MRGRDLETELSLSFDQAVNGAQVTVTVPKAERCPTCHGSGAKPGTSPVTCPRCEGRGIDAQSQGFFSISQPCPQCGGAGQIIEDPCPTCGGSGLTQQTKRYKVNIPAGVKDGARIRLAGKGEAGQRGGPPGDLFVVTRVAASPVFKRLDGGNLEVTVPITIAEALRGATIEVPTLEGTKKIKVGAGDQARLDPAAARRGRAEAEGPRQGRHPLPARDRDAGEADRRSRRRRPRSWPRPSTAPTPAPSCCEGRPMSVQWPVAAGIESRDRTRGCHERAAERIEVSIDSDQGVFMISVAAELAHMHPQTLRIYEARGLIQPKRSPKNTRLYSQRDVERLRRIQRLTAEGLNLAGVERVLALERRLRELEGGADATG